MPRNASGTYTLPAGNPVEAGTLIEASWANSTLEDMGNEITNSLSRTGEGGMLAPFRLADGTLGAPGIAWLNEPSTGFYRSGTGTMWGVVQGAQILQYTANGILIPSGKTLTAQGNVTVGGTLSITGAVIFSGALDVAGNFAVATNKFTVAAATGNTNVAGTLAVTGAITATGGVVGNVTGNVSGNAGTVTNGVYTTGDQTIGGTKTFSSTISGSITGNAGTVTNGVYTNGSYADPAWLTSLAGSKITGNISGNAGNVTGTVAVANGGTGATSAANARVNLLPSYTGNALKFLRLNAGGTDVEWATETGVGTVTSVDASGGSTGLSFTGGPITSSGTLTLGGTLGVANGGTGATTASLARSSLGLAIGTDVPSPTGTGASGTWGINVTGNAGTVTNGVYTNGSYSNPSWLTSLAGNKITGAIDNVTIGQTTAAAGSFTTLSASTSANLTVLTSTGLTKLGASTGSESLRVAATTSAVNYVRIYGGATGSAAVIDAQGTDTNVDLSLSGKGTGAVNLFGNTVLNGGTANGVAYLNGSKVLTTGSALTFDGTNFGIGTSSPVNLLTVQTAATGTTAGSNVIARLQSNASGRDATLQFSDNVANSSTLSMVGGATVFRQNGTESMRITSAGDVGIGTSSPSTKLHVLNTTAVITEMRAGNSVSYASLLVDGTGASQLFAPGGTQIFNVNGSERARIDSNGRVLVNRTSAYSDGNIGNPLFQANNIVANAAAAAFITATTATQGLVGFVNPNGTVGQIFVSGSSTSYNTSSDYRLKENIQPMTDALAFVRKQRPVTYNWKADGAKGGGYIAHWMQEDGAGNCVTGTKDAVDADGKPVYQGIDTSFMVAPLNAAINELADIVEAQAAIITQLKARLDAANL